MYFKLYTQNYFAIKKIIILINVINLQVPTEYYKQNNMIFFQIVSI